MEQQDIDQLLQALDGEIARRRLPRPVRLVVVGGVYMLYFLHNRTSTHDVDIIPLDFPEFDAAQSGYEDLPRCHHCCGKDLPAQARLDE